MESKQLRKVKAYLEDSLLCQLVIKFIDSVLLLESLLNYTFHTKNVAKVYPALCPLRYDVMFFRLHMTRLLLHPSVYLTLH